MLIGKEILDLDWNTYSLEITGFEKDPSDWSMVNRQDGGNVYVTYVLSDGTNSYEFEWSYFTRKFYTDKNEWYSGANFPTPVRIPCSDEVNPTEARNTVQAMVDAIVANAVIPAGADADTIYAALVAAVAEFDTTLYEIEFHIAEAEAAVANGGEFSVAVHHISKDDYIANGKVVIAGTEPETGFDANPENIGILYEDAATGIQISQLIDIGDGDTEIQASGDGTHGGHESKVVRTKYGTFVVYVTADPSHTGDNTNVFSFFKITATGGELIYQDSFEHSNGSCVPNILPGENGMLYIVLFNGDARLTVYTYDAKVGGTPTKDVQYGTFDYSNQWVHGYGYSQPVIDNENGKIYAIFNGGDVGGYVNDGGLVEQGYIAWFVYDIATGTWDPECYTVTLDWRVCYDHAYPDGNGGMFMVAQRDVLWANLYPYLGVNGAGAGYAWDALYLIHVPDVYKEECKITTIYEPAYSTTDSGVQKEEAKHYATGATLVDSEGNLHVVYSVEKSKKYTINYAVYDSELNEIRNAPITLSQSKNKFLIAMGEGADGSVYIFGINRHTSSRYIDSALEIWKVADDFSSITCVCKGQKLLVADETDDTNAITLEKSGSSTKMITTSFRNASDIDGVIGIVIDETDGTDMYNYYYFAVKLP